MEIYSSHALKILNKNFKYPIVETPLGLAVQMDAIEAFLFANVTGAGYFDNPTFLFSPKGTQKTLREAFQYNFVTGIYNGTSLFYSPSELRFRRPYLFAGNKYIVFKEFTDECQLAEELQDDFDYLIENNHTPTDYIIARIEASKLGNGMEPFLEYLACEYFKKAGFIVENQLPLAATVGSPDFGGYHLKCASKGFHLNELALIRITKNIEIAQSLLIDSVIVGEAKTATTIMEKQLRKYLNTQLFSKGYELHPDKSAPSIDSFGLLNISSEYTINVKEPKNPYSSMGRGEFELNAYIGWVHNYFKYYLMANFTQIEFNKIIVEKIGTTRFSHDEIISVINGMTVSEIIHRLQEVL